MFRYLGITWNARDPSQCHTAAELRMRVREHLTDMHELLCIPGLVVYWGGKRPGSFEAYLLPDRTGVVIGKLFERIPGGTQRPVVVDASIAKRLAVSSGRDLIERFWGHYVAFIRNEAESSTAVIRDPSGGIPCQVTASRDLHVVFSRIQDCLSLGLRRFTVNWSYVTARLMVPFIHGRETGLNEVFDVAPGEAIMFNGSTAPKRRAYWDPASIAETDPIEDFETAANAAQATVQACIDAWASGYPRIVHKLSGGVDSSIVLACLRKSPSSPEITCVNYFERSVWADERAFARLVVQDKQRGAADCKLIELERRPEDVQIQAAMQIAPAACPRGYLKFREQRRLDIPTAREERAALFTGTHGDGIFFTKRQYSAADYVYRHGLGADLLGIAHATAQARGRALWKMLPEAIRAGMKARRTPHALDEDVTAALDRQFVSASVKDAFKQTAGRYLDLPWLPPGRRIAPGKARHLRMMYLPTTMTNPLELADDPDWISPLASQPVMELFLRIPSYVLAARGQDRAVARRAFANDLPAEILRRRSKAVGNHHTLSVFRRNRALYRDTLLDGVLIERQLLDRKKVEAFFALDNDPGSKGLGELLQLHFNLEIWLRSWLRAGRAALQ